MGIILGIFRLVFKRSANNVKLLLATFLGLVIAVSLVSAVPLYTHGTLERLLQAKLAVTDKRPAGTVWLRSLLDQPDSHAVDQYHRLDDFVVGNVESVVNLPLKQLVRYVATDVYVLWPAGVEGNIPQSERRYGYIAFQKDFSKHIKIVDGTDVPPGAVAEGQDIPAIIASVAADELHIKVGDRFIYTDVEKFNPSGINMLIVGIWDPANPDEEYWIYDPYLFTNTLFISEDAMFQNIAPRMPKAIHEFSWYGIFDYTQIHSTNSDRVLSGLQFLETRAAMIVPETRLNPTLSTILDDFARRAYLLNIMLFTLSVPMVVVVLYYIATSIGMVIDRQRVEIALLKSRGASTLQVIAIHFIEALFMGLAALIVGPILGEGIAQLIGRAYGFLQFAQRPPLAIAVNDQTIEYAVGAVILSIAASLLPAIGAARHSITSYKQEAARSTRRPLWQRFFVDFVLLAVAAYGYNMLNQRTSILTLSKDETLLVDPLLLIVPAVFIFAVALLFLRVFPLITAILGKITSLTGGPAVPLALKQISRTPVQYMSLVLLLVLTLALGSYSASAAHTIDTNFKEKVLYDIPADLELWEAWEYNEDDHTYYAPPFQDHFVDGVAEASIFRQFKVTPKFAKLGKDTQFLAIDRLTYDKVGWWRKDFSDKPLGALMNVLGAGDSATIVSRSFAEQYQLHVGDSYTLLFDATPVDFYVAELVDYFPTQYPAKMPFMVGNIDYVNDQIGIQPYRVWLKLEPGAKAADVVDAIRGKGIKVVAIRDSRVTINQGRTDPQRTGLFGVLTVGFGVAALLTVLGFFLYSFLSFQKRLVQMGILRAMGLSIGQLFSLLLFEQVFLIALGVAFGTGLGVAAGSLFIPFLQFDAEGQVPKFVVETAWTDIGRIYIVLGVMLLAGLASTVYMISSMKLYQTVKMGEEQ